MIMIIIMIVIVSDIVPHRSTMLPPAPSPRAITRLTRSWSSTVTRFRARSYDHFPL